MKIKLVLIFCIAFSGYVNCNCGIPSRKPDPPEVLKEEYLDMVLRRNGDLDEPYRRPFCTEEEQILWTFRGLLITMPSDLRSKMLNARRKGLPWEPYEAQMKEKKVTPVSPKPGRCGLIRRKQKPPKQVMEDYLDLVLLNRERLVRPPCRPFCIEEEQIMWLLRGKLETTSSQLKSDILDARRNKRPWLNLLKSRKKSTVRTTTTKKPTTVSKKPVYPLTTRTTTSTTTTTTTRKPTTTTTTTTTTRKPTTTTTTTTTTTRKPTTMSTTTTTTTTAKPTTLSSTPKLERKMENTTTPKITPTSDSSSGKERRDSEKSETMKFLTEMTTSTSPATSSTTSAIFTLTSSTTARIALSSTTPPKTMMNTTTEGSIASAKMTTISLGYTPKLKRRFGESDTFETSDIAKLLTTTSKPDGVVDKSTSTIKAINVTGVSSATSTTSSLTTPTTTTLSTTLSSSTTSPTTLSSSTTPPSTPSSTTLSTTPPTTATSPTTTSPSTTLTTTPSTTATSSITTPTTAMMNITTEGSTSDMVKLLTTTSSPVDVIDKSTSTAKATNVTAVSSITVPTTSMIDISSPRSAITGMTGISSTTPGIAGITNTSITTLETTTEATKTTSAVDLCFDPSELYDLTGNSIDIPMHGMMKKPGCKR